MKKQKIKIDKVGDRYTANGVPLSYNYWTEESDPPCPECGSELIFDDNVSVGDEYCAHCNKYLYPKCACGECSSEHRQNRPITLPEFRQKIKALEKQDSEELDFTNKFVDREYLMNLLNKIEVLEKKKYISPLDEALIEKQIIIIEEAVAQLNEGKDVLLSILYFKAGINIIVSELVDGSFKDKYESIIEKIDSIVSCSNYLDDSDMMFEYEYKSFYENIVKFYYPEEIEEPDDRFDSMYSAQVEEEERELNQKLEHGWEPKMKDIRQKIASIISIGGNLSDLVKEQIEISDIEEYLSHLLELQRTLDKNIAHYQYLTDTYEK